MTSQRISRRLLVLSSSLVLCGSFSVAHGQTPDPYQVNLPKQEAPKPLVIPDRKLTPEGKTEIIRGMTAEIGYARVGFPFGKTGITVKNGKVVKPNEQQMAEIMASYGAAVKAGDRAQVTMVRFKEKSIVFDINGGPERKKKWYERIQVSGMGGTATPGEPTEETNIHGSFLELAFDKDVPDVTPDQIKQLLDPVLNFQAKSATEGYLDTIPKKAKQAITDHKVLVGMNREMVTYALGRPPQKYRDKDGDVDYEEWIYGTPPQDVQFIRFEGDEVVRVETMKVDGTKTVRNEREITIEPQQTQVAQQQQPGAPGQAPAQPQATQTSDSAPTQRPSLRRPGEDETDKPQEANAPAKPGGPAPHDSTTNPNPNTPDPGDKPGQPSSLPPPSKPQ